MCVCVVCHMYVRNSYNLKNKDKSKCLCSTISIYLATFREAAVLKLRSLGKVNRELIVITSLIRICIYWSIFLFILSLPSTHYWATNLF